ncbi:MAG: PD40 domain-containing protein, partial [Ignavibacteriales bacterium]|nr:PD40 domain-containing protein [Ignavibacteriales bacterium]
MKNISTLRYILLNAIYCCAFALTALAQTPTITSLSPTAGPVGSTVTINGTNLDNATSVKFLGDGNITNTLQTGYQYYDVRAVAFSPDGNKIVAYAYPEIKIFDASDGTVLQTITYYNSDLVFLAFTSDGNSVVSVDYYGTVSVWNVNDGTQTISFSTDSDNYTAALSPNGQTIVVPGYYNTRLWNLADGTEIINFGYGDYFKYSVAFTSDGQTLAIGQYGNIALLNVNDGTLLRNISTNYTLLSLTFSSDGTKLFAQDGQTYYSDARIKRWNVSDGTLLNSFLINGSSSNAAFSPDGQTVAFANSGNKIKLFRMYNGTEIETFTKDYAYRLAYSPDGKTLAAAVSNNYPYNTVRLHRMWLDADITANTTDAIEATVPDYAIPAPIIVTTLNGNTMSSQTFTVERPLIEVSTEEMNFSNVQIGESVQKTFMIYNNGWASLECTLNATLPFSALPTTFSVAVGDSQEVTVTFAPTAVNDYNDVIEITHNAGNDPRNVSVFGSGVELLTGTKTVGAGIGRDYSTLQAAFDAISNTGINDSLILSLTDTSYSTTTLELFLPATYNPAVLIIRKTGLAANIKVRDGGFGLDLNVAGSNSVQFDNVTMILRNIDDWEFGVYLHSDDNENTELLSLSGLTISGSNEFYRGIVVANFENPNGKIEVKNNTINTAYTGILVEGFAVPEVAIENNTINLRSEGAEGGIVLEGGYNLSNDNTGSISVSGNTITAPSGYIGIGCYGDFERFNELLVENNTITGSQDADFGDGSIHLDNIIGWYPEDFKTAPNTGEKKQRFTKENRKEYIGTLKEKMLEHKTTLKEEYLKKREEVRTIAKEHDPEKRRALSEQRVEKLKAKIEANKEKHNIFRSVNSGFKSNDMNVHINHNTMSLVRGGGIWFGGDVYGFYETNVYFELKDNTLTQTDFIDGEVYGVFLGNGIFSYEGAVSVTFEGNTANSIGADMYCYPYSISNLEVNVNNNTLTGLYVGADVGTYSEDVVNGSLSGNVVTSRDSVSGGYFNIYVAQSNQQNSGTYTVANNIFNGCSLYVGADDGKITFDVKNNGIKNVPSGYAMYVSSEENVSATIQSNVIADNDYGLYLHTHIQPIIKNNTIIRNRNEGLYIQRSDEPPRLRLNNLYGNGTYDLVNNTSNTVNADSNWWGAATTAEMVANTANITKIYDNRDSSIYG